MSSPADDRRFTCPACGKRYRWKPEFAGRTAKCACGAKLVVPSESAAESSAPLPAGQSTCPSCAAALTPDAVLCVNCGYNLKTGQKLAAVVVETGVDDDAGNDAGTEEARAPDAEA